LNVGIGVGQDGCLERLGIKVLGTPSHLEVSEDRDLFVQALKGKQLMAPVSVCSANSPRPVSVSFIEIDIPVAQSTAVLSVNDALQLLKR